MTAPVVAAALLLPTGLAGTAGAHEPDDRESVSSSWDGQGRDDSSDDSSSDDFNSDDSSTDDSSSGSSSFSGTGSSTSDGSSTSGGSSTGTSVPSSSDDSVLSSSASVAAATDGTARTAAITGLAAGTWLSGGSGNGTADGSFGAWRGSPVTIASTWSDNDDVQENIWINEDLRGWTGDMDIAIGGLRKGETWAQGASGAYDERWRKAAQSLRSQTTGMGTVYVRFAHEMNGDWYSWSVNNGNVDAFKTGWVRFSNILKTEFPEAKLVFSVNKDNVADVGYEKMWPGDEYVDVLGVDFYDMYPSYKDQIAWDADFDRSQNGTPEGLGAHQKFALQHGKPLGFSEWGVAWADKTGFDDNPFYIQKMNDFFRENAGTGAGQVLYEAYFNVPHGGTLEFMVYESDKNPKAAAAYKSLTWGK